MYPHFNFNNKKLINSKNVELVWLTVENSIYYNWVWI